LGILYKAAMNKIRQNFIDELLSKGITKNKEGKSIHDMDYHELRSEIALQAFRAIDTAKDENKWF
jgi:hypothetical protein